MDPIKLLLRLERARRRLLATDPSNKEKLLAASRKVDKLVVEYYRARLGSEAAWLIREKENKLPCLPPHI